MFSAAEEAIETRVFVFDDVEFIVTRIRQASDVETAVDEERQVLVTVTSGELTWDDLSLWLESEDRCAGSVRLVDDDDEALACEAFQVEFESREGVKFYALHFHVQCMFTYSTCKVILQHYMCGNIYRGLQDLGAGVCVGVQRLKRRHVLATCVPRSRSSASLDRRVLFFLLHQPGADQDAVCAQEAVRRRSDRERGAA